MNAATQAGTKRLAQSRGHDQLLEAQRQSGPFKEELMVPGQEEKRLRPFGISCPALKHRRSSYVTKVVEQNRLVFGICNSVKILVAGLLETGAQLDDQVCQALITTLSAKPSSPGSALVLCGRIRLMITSARFSSLHENSRMGQQICMRFLNVFQLPEDWLKPR